MRLKGMLFSIAVVFAMWNIYTNGLNVRTAAVALMILVCLAMNVYNYRQKEAARRAEEDRIREKEELRQIRAEARRKSSRRSKRAKK